MVYLYYISCLRYTILAGNPRNLLRQLYVLPHREAGKQTERSRKQTDKRTDRRTDMQTDRL